MWKLFALLVLSIAGLSAIFIFNTRPLPKAAYNVMTYDRNVYEYCLDGKRRLYREDAVTKKATDTRLQRLDHMCR